MDDGGAADSQYGFSLQMAVGNLGVGICDWLFAMGDLCEISIDYLSACAFLPPETPPTEPLQSFWLVVPKRGAKN
jgi:hypothetical protein